MFRKILGYGAGTIAFVGISIVVVMSFIIFMHFILELSGLISSSKHLNFTEYAFSILFLAFCVVDKFTLGRIVRRCEAYANNISLKEHEQLLGMKQIT